MKHVPRWEPKPCTDFLLTSLPACMVTTVLHKHLKLLCCAIILALCSQQWSHITQKNSLIVVSSKVFGWQRSSHFTYQGSLCSFLLLNRIMISLFVRTFRTGIQVLLRTVYENQDSCYIYSSEVANLIFFQVAVTAFTAVLVFNHMQIGLVCYYFNLADTG